MRVGIIGTGAISHKHAQAYAKIGYQVSACTDFHAESGQAFARRYGCEFVPSYEELCRHPQVDYVDVCTFPAFRLEAVTLCAEAHKHVQVQKPMATDLETARKMIETACNAGIQLGVVSQHRFDDSTQFLQRALAEGRLGKILQADAYVKWYRSPAYYSRAIKGSWQTEGGGALITQAIHQVDVLLTLIGGISELFAYWQLAARHNIESEDVLSAVVKYQSGATGVIQASTAFWPGYTERVEIHGTKGTAIISGDRLTTWHVENDHGEPAPVSYNVASAATDPMGTALAPFERQFIDFGEAIRTGRKPLSSGDEGYRVLQVVAAVYDSCRKGCVVTL
ncbi:MAG TPA: Gfo/Idh/MocA family oxidoreductase [Bryobacteraceae bacterium]|nr:Gfo/Idh/MocA family oxidoreductase [Bryobacteraceae bacterium]